MHDGVDVKKDLLSETLANQALDSANDGVSIVDMALPDQPLIYVNKAFEEMTGYKKNEVIGKNCRFLQGAFRNQPQVAVLKQAMQKKEATRVILKNFKKDGTLFWNELSLAPIKNSAGQLSHYVGVQKDVTKEIIQQERIAYLSEHDDLTSLYNYRGLFSKVDSLIEKAADQHLLIGIGIADIDHFKLLNDNFGHIHGNHVLKIIGLEIRETFNSNDIVARFGGDEFCFVMIVNDTHTDFFYKKIADVIHATNALLSKNMQITMSAGIAIEKSFALRRIDRLIHLADNIMYEHKQLAHSNQLIQR